MWSQISTRISKKLLAFLSLIYLLCSPGCLEQSRLHHPHWWHPGRISSWLHFWDCGRPRPRCAWRLWRYLHQLAGSWTLALPACCPHGSHRWWHWRPAGAGDKSRDLTVNSGDGVERADFEKQFGTRNLTGTGRMTSGFPARSAMWRYRGTFFSAAPALQTARETPRMAFAPNLA